MFRHFLNITATVFVLHAGASVSAGPLGTNTATQTTGVVMQLPDGTEVLPGVVKPRRSVTLGATFDARLYELVAEEGQRVRQGDIIARLDDRAAAAAMALAQLEANQTARITRAQLVLDQAERVLGRTKTARARGAATDEELTTRFSEVAMARADLAEANELKTAAAFRLREAAVQVERHLIRAPFDGTVMQLAAEAGAIVKSGDPIAVLSDVDRVAVDLFLPAKTAGSIAPGQMYALRLHDPVERVLWARARYVEPRIEPTSGTMRAVFDFELPNTIRAGTLVTPAQREPNADELAFMQASETKANLVSSHSGDQ